MTSPHLLSAVANALRRAVGTRGKILIAVSGGADSTALMHLLATLKEPLGLNLEVGTIDHQLRPTSAQEAAQVVSAARSLGLVAHSRAIDLEPGSGIEARARVARYAALETLRAERSFDWVATAHTASDQAETLLMRLGRGAALLGAGGIQPSMGRLIRPLLSFTHTQLEAYLREQGIDWMEDPMNRDLRYLRVRTRRELLPVYEQMVGPDLPKHLARFAQYAQEDDLWLSRRAAAALERVCSDGALDGVGVEALDRPIRRRVIHQWLQGQQLPVDSGLIEDIIEAIAQGRNATLPHDRVLIRKGGWFQVEAAAPRAISSRRGLVVDAPTSGPTL